MGVRGLTTYIAKNDDRYLDSFELHDCNVVIDGDSLSCQLHKSINSAFGGNYDQFFRVVCSFFEMLEQCNVTAFVLLDGGYQPKKLKTVKQRLRSKIGAIKHLNPFNSGPTFPIMMREVFVEALEQCNVQFMRCIFEADDEVAALSRKLNCPVLSFDSDFYIHDVIYIPLSTLTFKAFRRKIPQNNGKKNNSSPETTTKKFYYVMQCSMYQIKNLIRNRELRAEMLPLFAVLLGNDYVSTSIFKKFYLNVSMKNTGKKNTKQGKRIVALLRWLQDETLTSAVNKIINHVEKDKKVWIREQIANGMSGYVNEKSVAYDYFGLSNAFDTTGRIAPVDTSTFETKCESEKCETQPESSDSENQNADEDEDVDDGQNVNEIDSDTEDEPESDHKSDAEEVSHEDEVHNTDILSFKPPEWLLSKILSGRLPRYIVDLMTMRLYINSPQVENFQLADCNKISVPILQLIFSILHANKRQQRGFRYLTRVQRRTDIEYRHYEPVSFHTEFDAIQKENHNHFFTLLFDDYEVILKRINEMVPPDVQLLFLGIIYWSRNSKHFNVVYVCSLLLCQIALDDNFSTEKSKIMELFPLSEKLRTKHTEFSSDIIHGFAELQSILYHLNCLNVLCDEPYPNIMISKSINGCFLFNAYTVLKERPNIKYYIHNYLLSANSFQLFEKYLDILSPFIGTLQDSISKRKKRRNIKKKLLREQRKDKIEPALVDDNKEENDGNEVESDFEDMNNKFSCLLRINT